MLGESPQDTPALSPRSVARRSYGFHHFLLEEKHEITEAQPCFSLKLAVRANTLVVSWHLNERMFMC